MESLKKFASILLSLMLITSLVVPLNANAEAQTKGSFNIQDKNLENAIIDSIYPHPTELKESDMKNLNYLYGSNITNLSGLEHAENLKTVKLYEGGISDLSPISKLVNLNDISFSGNKITSLSPLEELGRTVRESVYDHRLDLSGNQITDLNPLKTWSKLGQLFLQDNSINDIKPLKDLPVLNYVYLTGNPLNSDAKSVMRDLIRRDVTVIHDYEISTPDDIFIVDKAVETAIRHELSKPTGFITQKDMEQISQLTIDNKGVHNLGGLEFAINLTALSANNNQITDLDPLLNLKKLSTLSLKKNNLRYIGDISSMSGLTYLDLSDNGMVNFNIENVMPNLTELNVSGNDINDVYMFTISNIPALKKLNLLGNILKTNQQPSIDALIRSGISVQYDEIYKINKQDVKIYLNIDSNESIESIHYIQLESRMVSASTDYKEGYYYGYSQEVQRDPDGRPYIMMNQVSIAKDYTINIQADSHSTDGQKGIDLTKNPVEVKMYAYKTFSGTLVDQDNKPIPHTFLTLEKKNTYETTGSAFTDYNGRFTGKVSGTPIVDLYMHLEGRREFVKTIDLSKYMTPEIDLGIIKLEQKVDTSFLHGKVLDENGNPLSNLTVTLRNESGQYVGNTRTDKSGYFLVENLIGKVYTVSITDYRNNYNQLENTLAVGPTEHVLQMQPTAKTAFSGEGNSFVSSRTLATPNQQMTYQLNYKNNSSQAVKNAKLKMNLPSSVQVVNDSARLNGENVTLVGNTVTLPTVAPGESGKLSITVTVQSSTNSSISSTGIIEQDGKTSFSSTATTDLLFVTLNAPGQTATKEISVYGLAKPGATVKLFINDTEVKTAEANAKWWFADLVLPISSTSETFTLRAEVTENGQTYVTDDQTVQYATDIPTLEGITATVGNTKVKPNPYTGIATSGITVNPFNETNPSQDMTFSGQVKGNVDSVSLVFLNEEYPMELTGSTFKGEIPGTWLAFGNQLVEIKFTSGDHVYQMPLLLLTVLIDPSGYVFEGSMQNRLPNVQAIVEEKKQDTWKQWDAAQFGQVNPQLTDNEGKYGWDVPVGEWRVQFTKPGYLPYTSRNVVVPPPEMELNVPLISTDALTATIKELDQQKMSISFNRPVNEATIQSDIKVINNATKQEVPGTLSLQNWSGYKEATQGFFVEDASLKLSKEVIWTPTSALATNQSYSVIVGKGTSDYRGQQLSNEVTKTFSVFDESVVKPKSYASNYAFTITLTHEADETTLSKGVTVHDVKGNAVPVTFKKEGKTIKVIPPKQGYAQGIHHMIVTKELKNVSGKTLKSSIRMTFEVK